MVNKKAPNDTDKEERSYEPFKGARNDFIKDLEKKEREEKLLESFKNTKEIKIEEKKDKNVTLKDVPKKRKGKKNVS